MGSAWMMSGNQFPVMFADVSRYHPTLQSHNTTGMKFIAGSTQEMPHAVLEHLAQYVPVLDEYGYPLLLASNLVEGFGIPMPGQTLLMAVP
jgi:hypothetical protein